MLARVKLSYNSKFVVTEGACFFYPFDEISSYQDAEKRGGGGGVVRRSLYLASSTLPPGGASPGGSLQI